MSGFCKVIICGRLGKDPEAKTFGNGNKIVNLSMVTSETWKDKLSGEKKERAEWYNVVIQNENAASVAERFLRKGSEVLIEGTLQTRKWQGQDGADRYTTEVVVGRFNGSITLIGGRSDAGGGSGGASPQGGGGFDDGLNDDVPF